MSWQCPASECHKVTAGFRSKLIQSAPQRITHLTSTAKIRAVSRYDVITTVCQLGHWQNQAQPFDVFSACKCDWKKPAPLYSNNVLLVCGAGEAWEYYKNVIVFVAGGYGQNCHRLWWAFRCQFKSSSVAMGR